MPLGLKPQDIILAALLALVITWVLSIISYIFKAFSGRATEFAYSPKHSESVLKRCCHLFPNEDLVFKGLKFSRGMTVRITTYQNRFVEGKFIGSNNENMVCLLTDRSVIAQELGNIEDIIETDKSL